MYRSASLIREVTWLLGASIAMAYGVSAAADCIGRECYSRDLGSVTEVPRGVVDGHNAAFQLSAIPKRGEPIRVFRNGIPLLDGVDYQLNGPTLTILTARPVSGDVLHVVYTPGSVSRSQSVTSSNAGTVNAGAVARASEITAAAARDALQAEARRVGEDVLVRGQQAYRSNERAYLKGSSVSPSRMPQSLRSLMELEQQPSGRDIRKERRGISTQGIDGLGDGPVDARLDKPEAEGEVDLSIDPTNEDPSAGVPVDLDSKYTRTASTGSAISMLQRRLRSQSPEQSVDEGIEQSSKGAISKKAGTSKKVGTSKKQNPKWQLWQ